MISIKNEVREWLRSKDQAMQTRNYISSCDIRAKFSASMSAMYRQEVPAYGTMVELVTKVNKKTLYNDAMLRKRLEETGSLERISEERHGAIRLGTATELATMRRVFAVMGMHPVGYYDLSTAGVPVHSTAFRPSEEAALKRNPFRVFTSLLRLDLIADHKLRQEAEAVLAARQIFTPGALQLTEKAGHQGGLDTIDADRFVSEVVETFRWHDKANVSIEMYDRLHDAHRLIADIISFRGPHINHLTPRTLDIDRVQAGMHAMGIVPKATIEGPPARNCPILLRQTSFKALEESVSFPNTDGSFRVGSHTARFGEIEQRGIALTPKGRALYDRLLNDARTCVRPAPDGSNTDEYRAALDVAFQVFPDDWDEIRKHGLGYFTYRLADTSDGRSFADGDDLETMVAAEIVQFDPIDYEDFLPVSAAGIFQSNLGDGAGQDFVASPNQMRFEQALGTTVLNEFDYYAGIEKASIARCMTRLRIAGGLG
jgi:uncharacterized glyoxalase superfamily metalloenzyme YdcJ